jgi:hypothetical protein
MAPPRHGSIERASLARSNDWAAQILGCSDTGLLRYWAVQKLGCSESSGAYRKAPVNQPLTDCPKLRS